MWVVVSTLHRTDMRSNFLPKSLLAAALGGVVVVAGFGAQNATADQTSMFSVAAASDDAEAWRRGAR